MREAYARIQQAGGDAVLVSMDEPQRLHVFKEQLQLPYVCLSDPNQVGYRAFQCPRGSAWSVIGPAIWWRAIKSLLVFGLGRPHGDVMQLPGSFVIDRAGTIRLAHRSQHSADWTTPAELVAVIAMCSKSTVH